MKRATINFKNKEIANQFATDWSRHTLKGYVISPVGDLIEVSVHNVEDCDIEWIDNYVAKLNEGKD